MSMTKKERAAFDTAIRAARVAGALRWTSPAEPDLHPPQTAGELVKGWLFNAYSGNTARACTSAVFHAFGNDDHTTTQGARRLYSTELLALKALRHQIEKETAARLADIDERIAAAEQATCPECEARSGQHYSKCSKTGAANVTAG